MRFNNCSTEKYRILGFVAGGMAAFLGFVAFIGWHTHSVLLVQLSPALVPMQYNTALGFVLSGLALTALVIAQDRLATGLAVTVMALGLLTISQYVFSIDLGIDQFLMQHYVTVQTSHPGRMAPNTALSFMLVAAAILLSKIDKGRGDGLLLGLIGSAVLGLGTVATLGYVVGLEGAYGWGRFTRMALHTSLGFVALGVGLLALAWQTARHNLVRFPHWLGISSALAILTITFVFWQALALEHGVENTGVARNLFAVLGIALAFLFASTVNRVISERASKEALTAEIAEHMKTTGALEKSDGRYRAVVDSQQEAVSRWWPDESISFVNLAYQRVYQKSFDELVGTPFGQRMEPADRERFMASIAQIKPGSEPITFHGVLTRADGEKRAYQWLVTAIPGANGEIAEYQSTGRDVTELKEAEFARQESEGLLAAILDNAPTGISVKDRKGDLKIANAVARERLGIGLNEALWENPRNVSEHPLATASAGFDEQVFRTGVDMMRVISWQNEGEEIAIQATKFPIHDAHGNIQYVGTISTDITQQRKIATALQENEERYRLATGAISDAVWDLEVARKQMFFSERFGEMLGYDIGELSSSQDTLRAHLHPEERPRIIKEFEAFLDGGENTWSCEYRLRKKDGSYRLFQTQAKCLRDEDGKATRATGVLHDITDERAHDEQLYHAQKMQAVGEMGSGIAHDFNNILSIVMGNLELLKVIRSEDQVAMKHIETALRGVNRGAALTERLLSFSRVTSSGKQISSANKCLLDLREMISKSGNSGIAVITQLSQDLWNADFDPGDFDDVIVNLTLNARDAMPDGGTLKLLTANKVLDQEYVKRHPGSRPGEFVMVSVSDTGTGIAEELRERIFDPFFTTKPRGKGTGLGLSMVYGFVERSGGHIELESELEKGTVFRLFLPRAIGLSDEAEIESKNEEVLPQGSEVILVVEDEEDLLDIAVSHLTELGYDTLAASDGKQALEIIGGPEKIDLLFTDIVMPSGIDGFRLAMDTNRARPDIKILLTSGFAADWSQQELGDSTFRAELVGDLLRKPYSKAELAKRIRARLGPHE